MQMQRQLSLRERQVLKLMLAEYTQKEICAALNIHSSTVSTMKQKIMEKWDVTTMVGMVKEAIKRGYLEIESFTPVMKIVR